MTEPGSRKSATIALIALAVVLIAGLAAYVRWTAPTVGPDGAGTPGTSSSATIETVRRAPHMLFRHTGLGNAYGRVVLARLAETDDSRVPTSLACDRVHYAAGRGVCLAADRGVVTTYRAITFDDA